jgi:hypothetical protein
LPDVCGCFEGMPEEIWSLKEKLTFFVNFNKTNK